MTHIEIDSKLNLVSFLVSNGRLISPHIDKITTIITHMPFILDDDSDLLQRLMANYIGENEAALFAELYDEYLAEHEEEFPEGMPSGVPQEDEARIFQGRVSE